VIQAEASAPERFSEQWWLTEYFWYDFASIIWPVLLISLIIQVFFPKSWVEVFGVIIAPVIKLVFIWTPLCVLLIQCASVHGGVISSVSR
jgi:hypothetical protein